MCHPLDVCQLTEVIAWVHGLPRLAKRLTADTWWKLWERLVALAAMGRTECKDPLVEQMLGGELPLALAYLFPEIVACRKLAAAARRVLSAGLVDLLDGEGLPHGKHLGQFRPLLACWTRCRAIGAVFAEGAWSEAAQEQYQWLVRHAVRWSRPDGSQMLAPAATGAWCRPLVDAALRLGGDDDDKDLATLLLPGHSQTARAAVNMALPETAYFSEWAEVAMLRPDWARGAPCLAINYAGPPIRIELLAQRDVLWSGGWETEVLREGKRLAPSAAADEGDWHETCWISNEEVDYLELECWLADDFRLERHILLARQDRFLLVADAVSGNRPGRLEYRSRFPLVAPDIPGNPRRKAPRVFWCRVGWRTVRGCCRWHCPSGAAQRRPAAWNSERGRLELRQSCTGQAMFAPLFVDLEPGRLARPMTWRQLTVAENLTAQSDDVAVGYRVQIGRQQWLFYRSLAVCGNRTLLGHNLVSEFLVARFSKEGKVEAIIETE